MEKRKSFSPSQISKKKDMSRTKDHGVPNKTVYCLDCAKIKTLDFNKSPAKFREETPKCATAGTGDLPIKANQAGPRPKMKNS